MSRGARGKKKRKSIGRIIGGWLVFIIVLVLIIFIGINLTKERTEVVGTSMMPTLADGDMIVVDQISYKVSDPKRFDVVVFPSRYEEDVYYIKRVIGLPGETIQINDGEVYINGSKLKEKIAFASIQNPGRASAAITLGSDEYFVLGDNRNDSSDSREPSIGNIRRKEISGRAFIRVWPMSGFGLIQ